MNKVEILSPCGDYNCFMSAVNAGCDAVYLSGNRYGARAYAQNFDESQLISTINYAHIFSVKVYLTVNTLVKNDELNDLYEYLLPLYKAGLDGVIVQDIGVIRYIRRFFPNLSVHASTQLAITGEDGVKLLKDMGVTRVVLAREVSLEEIDKIYKETGLEIECFVHGALCYSYSGKCLFSSLIGGRSGNRGRCAGPCRQPYNNNQYLLSTKDICCLKLIPKLIKAGIVSFKIEGRMKSPEYVAGVTGIYRKHVDRYLKLVETYGEAKAEEKYYDDDSLKKDFDSLVSLYTRGGNSEGYYFNKNGRSMISLKDASYQTGDNSQNQNIIKEYSFEKKKRINAFIRIIPLEEAELMLYDENNSVLVKGAIVQESENRPLDKETIEKQLKKTGDSPFEIADIEYELSDNSFLRVSELNSLRRTAVEALWNLVVQRYKREEPILISDEKESFVKNIFEDKKLHYTADILSKEQLNAALQNSLVSVIYVPFSLVDSIGFEEIKNIENTYLKEIYIKFPSVIRNDFFNKHSELCKLILDESKGVLVDNYETLKYLSDREYNGNIVGDIHIYSMNDEALKGNLKLGFDRVTIPLELNKKEIQTMRFDNQELIIYGRIPMMVSAQCVNNTLNGCTGKSTKLSIRDRKNAEFPVINNCYSCINTVYNSVPLSLHGEKDFIMKSNIKYLRMVFTDEGYEDTLRLLNDYTSEALDKNDYDIKYFTRGHINRGVL